MFDHYLDMSVNALNIQYELHARLITAAHRVIKDRQAQLAVAWPDWKESVSMGLRFRVFGSESDLQVFRSVIGPLSAAALITTHEISRTPVSEKKVAFLRVREFEKSLPAFQERVERRNDKRGRKTESTGNAKPSGARPHHVFVQSGSTGHKMPIFIRKCSVAENTSARSYGLGWELPDF